MIIARRQFLQGLGSLLAAPAIVRVDSIMPVKLMLPSYGFDSFDDHINMDVAYQWVSNTFGESRDVEWVSFSGWTPVPASRYSDRFDIKGDRIIHGGCTLMQKTRRDVEVARGIEIAAVKDLARLTADKPLPGGMHWLEPKVSIEIRPLEEDLKKYGR